MANKEARQFEGTAAPRSFFDRRLRQTGNTVSISVGKILPNEWLYVRMEVQDRDAESVTVKFTKLLEKPNNASVDSIDSSSEQDA